MRHFFFTLTIVCLTLFSCDDGDVFDVDFDFGDTFESCEETDAIFYKSKNDPSETLSVIIPNFSVETLFNVDPDTNTLITTSPGTFNYRTYSNSSLPNDLFCNIIAPSNVNIIDDFESPCSITFETRLTEDDNDGIPAEMEDLNNDGNLDNDDTDNDGIPNYLDLDDDGDNVLTANEFIDPNGDDDISDALDSDEDGIPNYLDNDDDNDGIPTRNEETINANLDPSDDITISNSGLPDYLNNQANAAVNTTAFRTHTVSQTYTVSAIIANISIDILSQDEFDFGFLTSNALNSTRTLPTTFN